ncbi:hypothetical protein MJA45_24985 [Paenibacillus aurantius]|uniref:Uncharacterized protein n=1 Tax=Paenibacillus aurantius TaxID=2918900 RepID=A0AA96LBV4_9BACL|nr:hypothetical protein [Paenibacillus aurantius]WJH35579.1 hypothetical protein N6H14_06115 [Paenibacillus sp. CC-CFT747]WNQ10837.1 hypothetical protein MJA45_24985 [Paenibacillus aurantius]
MEKQGIELDILKVMQQLGLCPEKFEKTKESRWVSELERKKAM